MNKWLWLPLALGIATPLIAYAQPATIGNALENLCVQGNTAVDKGDYDAAIAIYSRAIRLDANSARSYSGRAVAFQRKREYDKSIADDGEAIRIDPKMSLAYVNRGRGYQEKGEYRRAIKDLSDAIRLDPNLAVAYVDRAFAYVSMGEYEKAIAGCSDAIRLVPNLAKAFHIRGLAYRQAGENDKGEADAFQAKRLGYRDPDTNSTARGEGSVDPSDNAFMQYVEKYVKVSPEEKAAMKQVVIAHYQRMDDFYVRNRKKQQNQMEDLISAEMGKDPEAIKKAQSRLHESVLAPQGALVDAMRDELEDALAPAKRDRLREIRFADSIAVQTYPVRLGDDQMKRVRESFRELPKAADYDAFTTKLPAVLLKVLTPEQKTWIAAYRAREFVRATFGKVMLTADQSAKMGAIIDGVVRNSAFESEWPKFEGMGRKLHEKVNSLIAADQKKYLNGNPLPGASTQLIPMPEHSKAP